MPKMKSHKGLRKRIKVSARGKLKHRRPFSGHLMSGKSGARRLKLRRASFIGPPYDDKLRRAMQAE